MSGIKGIQLVLILLLGVDNSLQDRVDLYRRSGDTVSLPSNVLPGYRCVSTAWLYSTSHTTATVALNGKIHGKLHQSKASRMSLESNCSLTVMDVTAEDVGNYFCQQWTNEKNPRKTGDDKQITLFVLDITRGNSGAEQTLTCSLFGNNMNCDRHTLSWMNKDGTLITDSQSRGCSITLTSSQHDLNNKFTCQVARDGDVKINIVFPGAVKTQTQPTKPPPDPTTASTTKQPPTQPTKPPSDPASASTTKQPPTQTTKPTSSSSLQTACSDHLYVVVTVVRVVGTVAIFLMLLSVILISRRTATETPTIHPNAVIDN